MNYSVLLYSKYSENCKKIMELMKNSNLNFQSISRLQLLCIDNPEVRNRIKENKQINVTIVPCILTIYDNGTVEKFDGSFAYKWVENIIELNAPPPPPVQPPPPPVYHQPPPQQAPPPPRRAVETYQQPQEEEMAIQAPRSYALPQQRQQRTTEIQQLEPIEPELEDEVQDDRHRLLPQPKRVRIDENKYEEDPNLYQGEPVEIRREPSRTIRASTQRVIEDPNGTMARAKELAQGRDEIESQINAPSKRPIDQRGP